MLDEYFQEIKKKHLDIEYTENLVNYITDKGFNDKFGARPLRRAITKNVEDTIAYKYVKGELKENTKYTLDVEDNTVVLK